MTESNGHKMTHKRFPLNTRKCSFAVTLTGHWHRLPRDAVESHSSEIKKSHLDMVLGKQLQAILLEQGAESHELQRFLLTSSPL